MSAKTLWYISQYSIPSKYGMGTRHFYLSEEFIKRDWKVSVISASYNKFFEAANKFPPSTSTYNFEDINGVNVCWVKGMKYKKNEGIGRIISWLIFTWRLFFLPLKKFSKPDVIILSSLSLPPIIAAYYYKKRFNCKLIFEIRDIWPQTLIDVGKYSPKNPLIRVLGWMEKLAYTKADHITATMPAADRHIRKVISKDFKFKCIPQGISNDQIFSGEKLEDNFVKKYIPQEGFIIGYAGTLGKSNALETIVEAVKEISKTQPDIHLVFLGEGPYKSELVKLAEGFTSISFAPKIPKNKVGSFLENCTVLYDSVKSVPLYDYGLSRNKWMDYMLSGKPMLVSYTGYLSLINEADCGIVVPSEDKEFLIAAIKNMYNMSREDLLNMGKRGREFVIENRTFEKLADQYLKILNE
jgi:glycosyltransferase involved in cell wall biosynthesis